MKRVVNRMMAMICILAFILGLAVGAFLNLCIDRLPKNKRIVGKGACFTGWGTPPELLDRVAVLRLIFPGEKSRRRTGPSLRLPLVEVLTGMVYVMLFLKYSISAEFVFLAFLMSVLIAVFFIDLAHGIIPNELVAAGLAGGVLLFAYNLFRPFSLYGDRLWWNPLGGVVAGAGFLYVAALAGALLYKTGGALGMGDVKIFAPIGIFLGWRMTILALLLAILSAGIAGLALKVFAKKDWKYAFPYGPFIAAAVFVTVLWGRELLAWYVNRL